MTGSFPDFIWEAGRRISVFRIDLDTGARLGLLATTLGKVAGWTFPQPIIVRAGGGVHCGAETSGVTMTWTGVAPAAK